MYLSIVYIIFGILLTTAVFSNASKQSRRKRVVGGSPSEPGQFPFLVALETRYLINSQLYSSTKCGGSILSPSLILTAAHCFDNDANPESHQIRAGSNLAEKGGSVHLISNIVIHEKYDANSSDAYHDLALLTLDTLIDFDSSKAPIAMFEPGEEIQDGIMGLSAGWGRLYSRPYKIFAGSDPNYPKRLQGIEVMIVGRKKCLEAYGELDQGQICATAGLGKSLCYGDSGGPLIVGGRLAGVSSFVKKGCESEPYPNVFTEVGGYRKWIDEHLKE